MGAGVAAFEDVVVRHHDAERNGYAEPAPDPTKTNRPTTDCHGRRDDQREQRTPERDQPPDFGRIRPTLDRAT